MQNNDPIRYRLNICIHKIALVVKCLSEPLDFMKGSLSGLGLLLKDALNELQLISKELDKASENVESR